VGRRSVVQYNGVATSASTSVFGSHRERDVNTRGLESEELVDDKMTIDEHDAVFLIRSIVVEIPARSYGLLMEGSEDGLFDVVRDGHVTLWCGWVAEIKELVKGGKPMALAASVERATATH